MDAFDTRGFFFGFSSSPSTSSLAALARFGAALPLPFLSLVTVVASWSFSASIVPLAIASITFDFRGLFLVGLTSVSGKSERSLPGDSALTADFEAAARLGLAAEDMMRFDAFRFWVIIRPLRPRSMVLVELNVVWGCCRWSSSCSALAGGVGKCCIISVPDYCEIKLPILSEHLWTEHTIYTGIYRLPSVLLHTHISHPY
jgi:hypothetical protein